MTEAVRKRWGFDIRSPDPEIPSIDAEPAMFNRLLFSRKTGDFTLCNLKDAVLITCHDAPREVYCIASLSRKSRTPGDFS
jgi:hypothetical protein